MTSLIDTEFTETTDDDQLDGGVEKCITAEETFTREGERVERETTLRILEDGGVHIDQRYENISGLADSLTLSDAVARRLRRRTGPGGRPMSSEELPTGLSFRTPRDEWAEQFRRVVEYFEATADWEDFKAAPRYPDRSEPYVLAETIEMPAHADDDKNRPWHILFNPWPGSKRTCWKMDGRPLLPEETVHGADDPEEDIIARDEDLAEVFSGRVVVCVALTKFAGMHSTATNWLPQDERIEAQFDRVLDELTAEVTA